MSVANAAPTTPNGVANAGCGEWNTLIEEVISTGLAADTSSPSAPRPSSADARPPVALDDTTTDVGTAQPTGIAELDHVLSGGFVDGSVTLLGGEPGIGKSTLLLQAAHKWSGSVLYVCAEESVQQVRQRAERLGAIRSMSGCSPNMVLVKLPMRSRALNHRSSLSTASNDFRSGSDVSTGSVAQVRACAQFLVNLAKRRSIPLARRARHQRR